MNTQQVTSPVFVVFDANEQQFIVGELSQNSTFTAAATITTYNSKNQQIMQLLFSGPFAP